MSAAAAAEEATPLTTSGSAHLREFCDVIGTAIYFLKARQARGAAARAPPAPLG